MLRGNRLLCDKVKDSQLKTLSNFVFPFLSVACSHFPIPVVYVVKQREIEQIVIGREQRRKETTGMSTVDTRGKR